MPSNCTSDDIDLVRPTKYHVPPHWIAKKPPPKPWPLPDFVPLNIHDFDDHGIVNLPPDVNLYNSFKLYS